MGPGGYSVSACDDGDRSGCPGNSAGGDNRGLGDVLGSLDLGSEGDGFFLSGHRPL